MGPWLLLSLLLLVQGGPPPHPRRAPANATIFSHIYSVRRGAGEGPESPQEALAPPSQLQPPRLYEHTLEGDEQVVFTHRINLPPPACDCEGGGAGGALREALARLRALEAQVQALREQCGAKGCCPPAAAGAQAGTGQTDTQSLCGRHGAFDLATCGCVCQPGWGGPTCAEPQCPGGCGGRGECVAGRCVCPPGFAGARCETPVCADDCNDQGRCQGGRCLCFPGYSGPACETPDCPGDCHGRGRCQDGRCLCRPGYAGPDCGTRACPGDCSGRGRCLKNGVCACHRGYTGPDCSQPACPSDCGGHGECRNGECHCQDGYAGEDCTLGIDAPRDLRPTGATATSLSLRWEPPAAQPDGYTLHYRPVGRDSPEPPTRLTLPPNRTTLTLTGLRSTTQYTLTLTAHRGPEQSSPASTSATTAPEASGTEPPPTPSLSRSGPPPGDLAVTDVSPDRFRVTWTAMTGTFQHFLLQYREPGSRAPPGHTQVPGGKRSVIVTQLSPGTEYEVELQGVAPDGTISEPITTSVWTAPLGGGPGPGDLGALGVRNVTSDGFGLQWRARQGLFQSFLLRYEDAAGRTGPREAEVPADQRATRLGGLRPGTQYNVTLYGVHRGQLSPPLRASVRT
ncbi:hypothetical protein KIL84_004504, partial [Mauremys mutica]